MPTCPPFLCVYIYFSCLFVFALNYLVSTCAHFSRTYMLTVTQDFGTDIYPADVKSDESLVFNTSGIVSQDLLVWVLRIQNTRKNTLF